MQLSKHLKTKKIKLTFVIQFDTNMAQDFYIENLSESDDESVEPKMKAKRGKGRVYETFVSMTSADIVKAHKPLLHLNQF
jgi:hypothetical protein